VAGPASDLARPASITASSTLVTTSLTRNSIVGYLAEGRTSHQLWVASWMIPTRTRLATSSS
jgi:hypothetical protein